MIDQWTLEKLEAIDERTWGVIYKEIVRYAQFKLNKAGFEIRTERDSVDAEHFATLAIEKIFDGTRDWDFIRFPDLAIHLKGVVKSLISSHFKSSKKSVVERSKESTILIGASENEISDFEDANGDITISESPEEILISNENWEAIEKAFDQSKDEYVVFSEWLDGNPPRVIAESLEIPVNEVNNAIKKGKRIVKTLFKKQS